MVKVSKKIRKTMSKEENKTYREGFKRSKLQARENLGNFYTVEKNTSKGGLEYMNLKKRDKSKLVRNNAASTY